MRFPLGLDGLSFVVFWVEAAPSVLGGVVPAVRAQLYGLDDAREGLPGCLVGEADGPTPSLLLGLHAVDVPDAEDVLKT